MPILRRFVLGFQKFQLFLCTTIRNAKKCFLVLEVDFLVVIIEFEYILGKTLENPVYSALVCPTSIADHRTTAIASGTTEVVMSPTH